MTFSIIPAIDIKGGNCVRLQQGEFSKETIFSDLPELVAEKWVSQGADKMHIVDLDGASSGQQKNEVVIKKILKKYSNRVSIQVGGGIRDLDTIEKILDQGASFVVIGTAAVKNPGLLKDACAAFLGHIIVAIDAKNGKVATDGWSKLSGHDVIDLAKKYEDDGVEAILYTDISRDGMLSGINVSSTVKLAQTINIPVIASGGISGINDLKNIMVKESEGVTGVILGRALYEGKIDFKEAKSLIDDLA